MPEFVAWQHDQSHAVDRAVELIRAGHLVVFPTDTIYKIGCGLLQEAAARLRQLGDPVNFTLAITGHAQAIDWAPDLGVLGRRLARRCWPGPIVLITGAGVERGAVARLPAELRELVAPTGLVRLRAPDHDCILEAIIRWQGPILLSDFGTGASTFDQVKDIAGDAAALLIDDGPNQADRDATEVRLEGDSWTLQREGVVSASELAVFSPCHVLFVCTGNTCRSPLAQALCIKLLADRLGCAPGDLPQRGIVVQSAGLSAMMGRGASREAAAVAQEYGADLSQHQSRPLTLEMLRQADYLFVMTAGHLLALNGLPAQVVPQPRLLSVDGADVVDPFGGDEDEYRLCARQIAECLERLVPEITPTA